VAEALTLGGGGVCTGEDIRPERYGIGTRLMTRSPAVVSKEKKRRLKEHELARKTSKHSYREALFEHH